MTKSTRWFAAGLLLGLLVSLAPACQSPCGPEICSGCCDSAGLCQTGLESAACGLGGGACTVCDGALICPTGECLKAMDSGDGGADGGSDGGTDAGLSAPTNPVSVTVALAMNPARLGRNTATVTLAGANGVPVDNATLQVDVYMPAMGHGSTEVPVVTNNGGGRYTVSKVTFTMQGTWRVTVTATAPGGLTGSQIYTYPVN